MANRKRESDLFDVLRQSGLRRKVARALNESGRAKRGKSPTGVARTVENLRSAASEIESRVSGSRRTEAAKKAARTRKRNAVKRSASAKKAAKTRARTGR
ncbi:MAG: hypothetical protein WCB67_06695 [Solirubrobacteraceae bacterium]